ncbi:hypothetical protein O0Q50_32035 [Priestia aryabhattai]|uniref:Uncharacterized protein n=1 Tax=Priestia aryabhattai TaxID=412384 RepID=A0AAX6NIS6_PRIAR|nr:hypothetical protein [Priestia aryabhattai]MDU9695798.1 hypothetical protein [Priestia aryabhattai]
MITVPLRINVRRGSVLLEEDSMVFETDQITKIRRKARTKTKFGWLGSKTGVKIDLTKTQMNDVLAVKNAVVYYLTGGSGDPAAMVANRDVGFGIHANIRMIERLEALTQEEKEDILINTPNEDLYLFVSPATMLDVAESFIKSNEVESKAEWKAFPYLTYTFRGKYKDKTISMAVTFENGVFFVTLIDIINHNYLVGETETGRNLKDNF